MEKTIIAFKDFEYIVSMESFFKNEYKSGSRNYLIPIDHIKWFKRNIFPKIRDSCSHVCPSSVPCKGHKLLNYIQLLWDATVFADEEKYVYYRYFYFDYFENLVFKNDELHSWDATPVESKCLKHLTYSRRMAYLN